MKNTNSRSSFLLLLLAVIFVAQIPALYAQSNPPVFRDDLFQKIIETGTPANQLEMARAIVTACPNEVSNQEDFQDLCNALVGSGIEGIPVGDALKETTPDDAPAVRSSGMQTSNIQSVAVEGRLGTIRSGGGAGFSASGFNIMQANNAFNGGLVGNFLSSYDQNRPGFMQTNAGQNNDTSFMDEFGRWGAWISGRLVFGEKDATVNQVGYEFDTAGLTFGLDYRFSDQFVAGIAVGYSSIDADLGLDGSELDTESYSISLYGTFFQSDRFYMGGSIGIGSSDFDQLRNVRYKLADNPDPAFDVDQTFSSDYDGDQFNVAVNGGWDFNKDGWTYGPTFHVNYVEASVDEYVETLLNPTQDNATFGWAVSIDKQKYKSFQPSVGFEFSNAISRDWGIFIPQGYIEIVTELEDKGKLVTGQFRGHDGNDAKFALLTDDFDETFVRGGLGFGMVLKNNKSAFLMVDADLGRSLLDTYYINGGFRWQF